MASVAGLVHALACRMIARCAANKDCTSVAFGIRAQSAGAIKRECGKINVKGLITNTHLFLEQGIQFSAQLEKCIYLWNNVSVIRLDYCRILLRQLEWRRRWRWRCGSKASLCARLCGCNWRCLDQGLRFGDVFEARCGCFQSIFASIDEILGKNVVRRVGRYY